MNTPHIIEQGGRKFVQIPLEDYEKLTEDAEMLADVAAYDAAMKRWAADGFRTIHGEVVKRELEGASPLLAWREYRGLTQHQLAAASGVTRVLISQIETSKRTGSVATLKKLAEALGCALDDLTE